MAYLLSITSKSKQGMVCFWSDAYEEEVLDFMEHNGSDISIEIISDDVDEFTCRDIHEQSVFKYGLPTKFRPKRVVNKNF